MKSYHASSEEAYLDHRLALGAESPSGHKPKACVDFCEKGCGEPCGGADTPAHRLVDKYVRVSRLHHRFMERKLETTGVYRSQHQLLMFVARDPSISQKELARKYGVSTATIAVSLKKLEKGGYIDRKVDERDNRFNQIGMTEKGRKVVKDSFRIFQEVENCLCLGFSEEDYEVMGRLLDKMYQNMEDYLSQDLDMEKHQESGKADNRESGKADVRKSGKADNQKPCEADNQESDRTDNQNERNRRIKRKREQTESEGL